MAPLAPSNTPRFRVFYTVIGKQHSFEMRSHASPSTIGTIIDGLFTALSTGLYATTLDYVTYATTGSDVFNIVTTGAEGNTYGSGAGDTQHVPWYVNFIGRSSGGRRVRLAVFGIITMFTDFRSIAGESTEIDDAIDVLQTAGSALVAIDDLQPTWKNYANAGVNAHWQRALRP
jgi:hypothetical protein